MNWTIMMNTNHWLNIYDSHEFCSGFNENSRAIRGTEPGDVFFRCSCYIRYSIILSLFLFVVMAHSRLFRIRWKEINYLFMVPYYCV